jgi:cytochrome b561
MALEPPAQFNSLAIALHWLAATLILGNLAFGFFMVDLPVTPAKLKYLSWHKWAGVTILLVSAMRLLWKLAHRAPPLPRSMPEWQRRAAMTSHHILYLLFFAVPLTGWLFSSAAGFPVVYFGVLPLPDLVDKNRELAEVLRTAHHWANYLLAMLVAVHIAAALKHHFVDDDDVLARMVPFLKPRNAHP